MTTTDDRPLETGWLPDTPPDDNLVWRFIHSQAAVNEAWAAAAGGRIERTPTVALADPEGPVPFYTGGILLRPLTGPGDEALDATEEFLDATGGRPGTLLSVWPTPDLRARGWHLVGHPAFVCRPPVPLDERWEVAPGVEIREATAPEELAVAERVLVDGYPLPWAAGTSAGGVLPPALIGSDVRVRVAYVDGEPVAMGAVHTAGGVANLCSAATLPAARRRGAWAALVRARVLDAPDAPAVAFTSDYSRPGFARLGFLVVLRFTLWGRGDWG